MRKMALIGGGSVRTHYFMESLLRFRKKLDIGELAVMDTDAEKLRIFGGLARHQAEKDGGGLTVTLTGDLAEAVTGADYVVTTLRVGQDAARCGDERIALDLGLIGQETTGAGGFSYALRTIPVLLDYMRVIREKSPGAVVFNFTNPSGLVTQALYDTGYDNIVGICDNATGIKIDVAKILRTGPGGLITRVYGLNHLSWANGILAGGRDILLRLLSSDAFIDGFHPFAYFDHSLIRHLGEIPNGYLYYYYHRERALRNLLAAPQTRGEVILGLNEQMMEQLRGLDVEADPERAMAVYRECMHKRESSYMSLEMGGEKKAAAPFDPASLNLGLPLAEGDPDAVCEGYAGVVFNYIESLVTGKAIDLAVNVPNRGSIEGMADGDVVEVTCMIDGGGARPLTFAGVPESNLLLMKTIKRYEKLTVAAVRERSREAAVEALTIHPLVGSYSLARELVDRYLVHNAPYIGEWR